MSGAVAVFEALCWFGFVALLGTFGYLSFKQRRVVPGLWLVLGIFSMSWVEAPFDNAAYAQFHPDFHRLPAIGPIGMTQGHLPVIAPPGYTWFFLLPALIAVGIAGLIMRRYGTLRVNTLMISGLIVGMLWDGLIEALQAQYLHLWTFSRAIPPAISSGMGLYPPYECLAMGVFIAGATYILGNTTPQGDSVIDVWAKSRTASHSAQLGLQAVCYIVFCNVLYLMTYLPHAITKYAGTLTETGVPVPYPGRIAMQPESGAPQSNGLLGAVIVWGLLIGSLALTWWWARVTNRLLVAPTLVPSGRTQHQRVPLAS